MKIETKFDVNNLVKGKFDICPKESLTLMEVIEIVSQTCYAGTQVFYECRMIQAVKERERPYDNTSSFKWIIGICTEGKGRSAYQRFREDELIPATDQEIAIITGAANS